jgi:hypothetical protein
VKKNSSKTKTVILKSTRLGPFQVGMNVVIRAIPYHYIGQIETLGEHGVTLAAGAVWLADSARWGSDFLRNGVVNETEPYRDAVFVGYGVIADITKWAHPIPGQK